MLENETGYYDSYGASGSSTQLSSSFEVLDIQDKQSMNGQTTSGDPKGKLKSRTAPTPSMINPQGTHLKKHPERGNGVFATRHIASGSIIEESPVLIISKDQWEEGKMDDCILGEYGFCWRGGGMGIGLGSGKIYDSLNNAIEQDVNLGSISGPVGDRNRLVTNVASLFNHSSNPNVNYVRDFDKSVIRFTASREIHPGEELCICYAADETKLWFVNSDEIRKTRNRMVEEEEAVHFPPVDVAELLDPEGDEERRAVEERRLARQKRMEAMQGVPREAGRRELKKAKFFMKQKAAQEAKEAELNGITLAPVVAPKPVRPPVQASSASSSSVPSRVPTPLYPAIPERTVESPLLPAPLHSTKGKSRHEHDGPVILTPELDWNEQDSTVGEDEGEWNGVERIKGFTEREDDEALKNDSALSTSSVIDGPGCS
jgi:tRNA-specific adenosine deaminase 3